MAIHTKTTSFFAAEGLPDSWQPNLADLTAPNQTQLREYYQQAWQKAVQLEFPQPASEDWRWVDFSGLDLQALTPKVSPKANGWRSGKARLAAAGVEVHTGQQGSASPDAIGSVVLGALSQIEKEAPQLLESRIGTIIPPSESKIAAVVSALGRQGGFILIPEETHAETPISINVAGGGNAETALTHQVIWLERGAKATVFLKYSSPAASAAGTNLHLGLVEVYLGENAELDLIEMQEFNKQTHSITIEKARLEGGARLNWSYNATGGAQSKNFLYADLNGQNSEAQLKGSYFAGSNQILDIDTQQDHLAPRTKSDLLFKGAANGNGQAVWEGMIYVDPKAQLTDGYQADRNLVLSDDALVKAIPGLEILADDVRCSHGATVGRLDDEELFYLQARGINKVQAERMLVEGFFRGVFDVIPDEKLREELLRNILSKLAEN